MRHASSLMLTGFALASLVFLPACSKDSDAKAEEDKTKEAVQIPVEVSLVKTGPISAHLESTTTLEAEEQAIVAAKASGIAERLYVEEGQWVKTGTPLLQLDTARLKLELARAQSNLARLTNELERTKLLFDKRLISSDIYDKLRFDYDAQKASVDLSKLELDYATIRAPISGVIAKRNVKIGNMVQLHQPVFEIVDFDPLLAVIHVSEKDMVKLSPQQSAVISVDALAGQIYTAKILRIAPTIDAGSGTFRVTLAISDRKQTLKPGMFGRVAVTYAEHKNALLLPKNAVLSEDGAQAVFVVRDGKAIRTEVTTGFSDAQHIEISSGLKANEQVVITGQNSLKNEAKVLVLKPE